MDEMDQGTVSWADQLPRWQSHKIVRAAKITGVSEGEGLVLFRWHLAGGARADVDLDLASRVPRNTQAVGGYLVVYPDGFRSWSPADAFEGGYERISD